MPFNFPLSNGHNYIVDLIPVDPTTTTPLHAVLSRVDPQGNTVLAVTQPFDADYQAAHTTEQAMAGVVAAFNSVLALEPKAPELTWEDKLTTYFLSSLSVVADSLVFTAPTTKVA